MSLMIETDYRKALRLKQLEDGTAVPALGYMAFGSGAVPATTEEQRALEALVNVEASTKDMDYPLVVKQLDNFSMQITASTPFEGQYMLTEIGIYDTANKLSFYTPYLPPDGQFKPDRHQISPTVLISLATGVQEITWFPQVIDTQALIDEILGEAQAGVEAYSQVFQFQQIVFMSAVAAATLKNTKLTNIYTV